MAIAANRATAIVVNGFMAMLPWSKKPQQPREAEDELTVALRDIETELGNERVCSRKLCDGESRNRELAHADEADAELRDADNADSELADGYDAPRNDGPAVGTVLEGHVHQRQVPNRHRRLVLPSKTVPLRTRGEGSAAVGAGDGLVRHLMLALSTRRDHRYPFGRLSTTRFAFPSE